MTYTLLTSPSETTPLIYTGPEGSPNGTLESPVGVLVLASDGVVYIKTSGTDVFGWEIVGA